MAAKWQFRLLHPVEKTEFINGFARQIATARKTDPGMTPSLMARILTIKLRQRGILNCWLDPERMERAVARLEGRLVSPKRRAPSSMRWRDHGREPLSRWIDAIGPYLRIDKARTRRPKKRR
jgi:hypothetical protein